MAQQQHRARRLSQQDSSPDMESARERRRFSQARMSALRSAEQNKSEPQNGFSDAYADVL